MKFDMTTFGETMIRISVRSGARLINTTDADINVGGAESNAAVALARLGMKTAWTSRLTDNPLGRRIEADISRHGVDTSAVIWTTKDRVGTYFVEFAAPPRATTVLYDRKLSAASRLGPDDIDWKHLLNTRILHLTGITPALSASCKSAVTEAFRKAKARKIPVSFDINYRGKLWSPKAAEKTLSSLLPDCAFVIMSISEAAAIFGFEGEPEAVATAVHERFRPGVVVITTGLKGAYAWDGQTLFYEPAYRIREVIDRVGAGDAFAAGFIFGWLQDDMQLGLRYGVATSAMKLGIRGDTFWATREEVDHVIRTQGGDIER